MAKKMDPMRIAMGAYFSAIGREGGKKGGRWKNTTPEERKAIMRAVIDARIAKQGRAS
jgi:hypothetical protein